MVGFSEIHVQQKRLKQELPYSWASKARAPTLLSVWRARPPCFWPFKARAPILLRALSESSHIFVCLKLELTYFERLKWELPYPCVSKARTPILLNVSSKSSHTFERLKREPQYFGVFKARAPIFLSIKARAPIPSSVWSESSHPLAGLKRELPYVCVLKARAPTLLRVYSNSSHTFERLKRERPHLYPFTNKLRWSVANFWRSDKGVSTDHWTYIGGSRKTPGWVSNIFQIISRSTFCIPNIYRSKEAQCLHDCCWGCACRWITFALQVWFVHIMVQTKTCNANQACRQTIGSPWNCIRKAKAKQTHLRKYIKLITIESNKNACRAGEIHIKSCFQQGCVNSKQVATEFAWTPKGFQRNINTIMNTYSKLAASQTKRQIPSGHKAMSQNCCFPNWDRSHIKCDVFTSPCKQNTQRKTHKQTHINKHRRCVMIESKQKYTKIACHAACWWEPHEIVCSTRLHRFQKKCGGARTNSEMLRNKTNTIPNTYSKLAVSKHNNWIPSGPHSLFPKDVRSRLSSISWNMPLGLRLFYETVARAVQACFTLQNNTCISWCRRKSHTK